MWKYGIKTEQKEYKFNSYPCFSGNYTSPDPLPKHASKILALRKPAFKLQLRTQFLGRV